MAIYFKGISNDRIYNDAIDAAEEAGFGSSDSGRDGFCYRSGYRDGAKRARHFYETAIATQRASNPPACPASTEPVLHEAACIVDWNADERCKHGDTKESLALQNFLLKGIGTDAERVAYCRKYIGANEDIDALLRAIDALSEPSAHLVCKHCGDNDFIPREGTP